MENWQHPTGNQPKTASLVCLGPSRNAFVNAGLEADLGDAIVNVDEIWTLNRGVNSFQHDLLFVMDHIQGEADHYPRYGATLWKHSKPIITSDNADGWPDHVHRYPFLEIWRWLRGSINPMHGDWYHNSLAYIFVYAAFIGVKELRVFGADYHNHSSGVVEDGHPCVAYWVGKLESAGLRILAPADSGFLNSNQRGWIYGYRDDPRTIHANRSRFRAMVGAPADPQATALLSGERQVADTLEGIQTDHLARYRWAAPNCQGIVMDLGAGVGYGSKILAEQASTEIVIAVERSEESISYAKKYYDSDKIKRVPLDLDGKSIALLNGGAVDSATCFELIEHLADPEQLLKTLPATRLFASVPNESVIPYAPETAPFHHRHYTKAQFQSLLARTGWSVTSWHGQTGPESAVLDWDDNTAFRTLVVDAVRTNPQ